MHVGYLGRGEKKMNCPSCNAPVSSDDKFCKNCGASINQKKESESKAFGYLCPICKTPNPNNVDYCVKCGHWMLDTITKAKPISKKEFEKLFSAGSSSKKVKVASWIILIIFIAFYIISSPEIKVILSLLLGIIGLISIIKPLAFLGIKSRRRGFGVLLLGVIVLFISATFLPSANKTISSQESINIEEYKAKSTLIFYEDLARQTEKYVGKKAKFTGQVIQVQEIYGNQIILRVNVTKGDYDIYKDTIWINYRYQEGESRVLENDIINVWGEIKGRKSYLTILGNKITIPELDGMVIELAGK